MSLNAATLIVLAALADAPTSVPAPVSEPPRERTHVTGEWGGRRTWLAERGVTLDLNYTFEAWGNLPKKGGALLGHVDLALTVNSGDAGLWSGGTLYLLAQDNHGLPGVSDSINDVVGSTQPVSNLEGGRFLQVSELFLEQALAGGRVTFRVGKQDANRDFGTPRYGGNFINGAFGMFPNVPLPSYPTNGLGAVVAVSPFDALVLRAAVYEAGPVVGGLGWSSTFESRAGAAGVAGAAVKHAWGVDGRQGGTTSVGVWGVSGPVDEVVDGPRSPRRFASNSGVFVQNDERLYAHPEDPDDPRGWNLITRASWAEEDRNQNALFVGGSLAYHGLGARRDDTVGVGANWFSVRANAGGTPGGGSETVVEVFYKWRPTRYFSVQPDLTFYRTPGGDGSVALVGGARVKAKF